MSAEESFKINRYRFDENVTDRIKESQAFFEKNLWPLVYILKDERQAQAYVGETTDTVERMKAHLKNAQKQHLSEAFLISSGRFNKSATLDIEASLIKYMSADGKYQLMNGNIGIANHHYFQQKELYEGIFESVWEELRALKVVCKTLKDIDNSDLFKYSPYKALSADQVVSLKEILIALSTDHIKNIMVSGSAGTGKSVLAIFLFKLLNTDLETFKFIELGTAEQEIVDLVEAVKGRFPNLKMGLVIPMSSFRKTVAKIFSQVKGLKRSMVLGPGDIAKEQYDILLVDESHRLRRRVNLGSVFGSFDKNSQRLGLDPKSTSELQWILKQSSKDILFYDAGQRIRPSDVQKSAFDQISQADDTISLRLKTQLRSKGGEALVDFIKKLLQIDQVATDKLKSIEVKGYELLLFDSFAALQRELNERENAYGLCRLVAGYAWPWASKKDKALFDIELDGVKLRWNTTSEDWINTDSAFKEVGCIHTVQGYDLNYVGVIFGPEITYNNKTGLIEVIKDNYKDRTGKSSIKDPSELHQYIQHIYSTLILRGIKGAFIYVADPALKAYFANYIERYDADKKINYQIKVPLIQLAIEKGALIEVSSAEMDIYERDMVVEGDRLIACQLQQPNPHPHQNQDEEEVEDQHVNRNGLIALLRIVHEEIPTEHNYLSKKPLPAMDREEDWQVAEKSIIYEKQTWLPQSFSSARYVALQLKNQAGAFRTVVARFERLISEVSIKGDT